jgi:hypothetical protein
MILFLALIAGCGGKKTPASNGPTPSTMSADAGVADTASTMNTGTASDKPEGPDAPKSE